ncbi:DUF262 domain-containing protein [Leifsonia sp. H3M29-4]|uniref:DUF262 domain-containing protein n=1 Tax=Salinibacterium metalliresistens TaxID=3031321 RepID=UPI0023D9A41A|nr:DUF262 domain-containing protein [Salinibacterium metalliresistens]MDF1480435.1 DUF262 domain-containing protein [Salinibacterium metalliresistens]
MFWDQAAPGESRSISADGTQPAQYQIVDGQQRLTSLFAVIKGKTVVDEAYRTKSIKISFNPLTEKFEVWTPAFANSSYWVEDVSEIFRDAISVRRRYLERLRESGGDITDEIEVGVETSLNRVSALNAYPFQVVHVLSDVEKPVVADVFVRINSEGVSLKAYDYILTWLSVFWPEGRDVIERFARLSRITPEVARSLVDSAITWTAKNPFIAVEAGQVVRAAIAFGQNRAKLSDAYSALQAKDRVTGFVDAERQHRELGRLQDALPVVTNRVNWTEYIRAIQIAGFRSGKNVTSATNVVSSYVLFLLGREEFKVELARLRVMIARWLFMSQLTGRYTGSGESQLQKDLDLFRDNAINAAGFERIVNETIGATLTPDFWEFQVPQQLVTSSASLSPGYQCYLAALNILDADMFMLRMKVREWMDPATPAVRGLEGHHLFPREYQRSTLGIRDNKRINQAANFAPTDWDTNGIISDNPPQEYWPRLVAARGRDSEWMKLQHYWHALPSGWESMEYDEFLSERRKLIAHVIRDGFDHLGRDDSLAAEAVAPEGEAEATFSLAELIARGVLSAGDLLDPADPAWQVDAVISEDGTLVIDDLHAFDSLDEAARYLGVTNMSGFEFWALELDDGITPLTELIR